MNRILFYINTLAGGGAERVITQLASRFSEDQYDVLLVSSFPVENEYPLAGSVRKVYLEKEQLKQSKLTRNFNRIRKLRTVCREFQPDIAIAFMQEPNFRLIIATMGLPTKTIVSVRNDPNQEYAGRIGRFVGKCILPMANGCVFQTKQAQSWFPKRLQRKSAIIMNAVAESFFEVQRDNPQNVIVVGRLNKQKNHEMLIRAFARIADKHPEQNLLIYGKGDQKETLRELISTLDMHERVLLMGATTQVSQVLAQAGVFVLSSDYEGMPNALLEAMAAGVPCVSTDCPCGGPAMLIRNGKNGLLVPVGHEDAMANAIDCLLIDSILAKSLGDAAREDAEDYRPEKVFEVWKTFIERVINGEI